MYRGFKTHNIRKVTDLSGLWQFKAHGGKNADKRNKAFVPGCWETIPGFESYRGIAEYEKEIKCGGNIRIVFKGVSHTAQVYMDGKPLGSHYGAYTPFDFIAPAVSNGEHKLKVTVENSINKKQYNDYDSYRIYGGITRPVILEELPDCFIEYVHVIPGLRGNIWTLDISAKINNISNKNHKIVLKSFIDKFDYNFGAAALKAGDSTVLTGRMVCPNVRAYELDAPIMYALESILEIDGQKADDLIERIGFRELRVSGKDILFNGKPLFIKGVNRYEDHPHFGSSVPVQAMQKDIELVKNLGGNAIRTAHYPNDELFLDLCDEQGILIWEEHHMRFLTEEQRQDPDYPALCEQCVQEMVKNHFNHPSIFMWGILSECESNTNNGRQCYERQFSLLKKMDSSRPVSFASSCGVTDICLDLVNVASFDCYAGWNEEGNVKDYLNRLLAWVQTTKAAGKPLLISETGAYAIYGNRSGHYKWTEERQMEILDEQLGEILSSGSFAGVFVSQLTDIRVNDECFENKPRTMDNKGIYDEFRRAKLANVAVKRQFRKHRN